jgi:SulP family sulfate permease
MASTGNDTALWAETHEAGGWTGFKRRLQSLSCRSFIPRLGLLDLVVDYASQPSSIREKISGDFSAGVVVAIMLVPQSLAYAALAQVPVVHGYYSAILSLFVYPLFGRSPYIGIGPVALVSILTAAVLNDLNQLTDVDETPEDNVNPASKLAFLVGVIQVAFGLLKIGYVVNFLSHTVISAFTTASAIVIATSQLNKIFGFSIAHTEFAWQTWYAVGKDLGRTNWQSFVYFVGCVLLLHYAGKAKDAVGRLPAVKARPAAGAALKMFPPALLMVIVTVLLTRYANLTAQGIKIVGSVPSGMPPFSIGAVFDSNFATMSGRLLPPAMVIALVGFMEAISVARSMSAKYGGEQMDADQELLGIGAANIAVSLFGGFPVTGSFSRTSVQGDAGAKTPLAGIIAGAILSLVVSFGTHLFFYLPNVALAALICYAVSKLLDFGVARELYAVDPVSCGIWVITLVLTIAQGTEIALLVGAGMSLVRLIKEASLPHVAVLGRMPGDVHAYRDLKRFPGIARSVDGIGILRVDAPLFFGNTSYLQDRIMEVAFPPPPAATPKAVLLDLSSCNSIDISGCHFLFAELRVQMRKHAAALTAAQPKGAAPIVAPPVYPCGAHGPVRDRLAQAEAFHHAEHEAATKKHASKGNTPGGSWVDRATAQCRHRKPSAKVTPESAATGVESLPVQPSDASSKTASASSNSNSNSNKYSEAADEDGLQKASYATDDLSLLESRSAFRASDPLEIALRKPDATAAVLRQIDLADAVEVLAGLLSIPLTAPQGYPQPRRPSMAAAVPMQLPAQVV